LSTPHLENANKSKIVSGKTQDFQLQVNKAANGDRIVMVQMKTKKMAGICVIVSSGLETPFFHQEFFE
jgi:arginine/ornithine N-succinyltransferase beta subunit